MSERGREASCVCASDKAKESKREVIIKKGKDKTLCCFNPISLERIHEAFLSNVTSSVPVFDMKKAMRGKREKQGPS